MQISQVTLHDLVLDGQPNSIFDVAKWQNKKENTDSASKSAVLKWQMQIKEWQRSISEIILRIA